MPKLGDFVQKRSAEDVLHMNIADAKVGGYNPPAPSDDPVLRSIGDEIEALNRPWSSAGQAVRATQTAQVEPQRLGDVVKSAFVTNNSAVNAYTWLNTFAQTEYDPTFKMRDNQDLLEGIPADLQTQFRGAGNRAGAERIRENILNSMAAEKSVHDAGLIGTGASFIAGAVDLDSIVPLGLAAKTAKATSAALKLRGMASGALKGAAAGAAAAAITEPVLAATSPTGDWSNVPVGILSAGAFGSLIGAGASRLHRVKPGLSVEDVSLAAHEAAGAEARAFVDEEAALGPHYVRDDLAAKGNESMRKVAQELGESVDRPAHPLAQDVVPMSIFHKEGEGGTAGLTNRATEFVHNLPKRELFSGAAKRFMDAWNGSEFTDDAARLFNSESPTAKALAYHMFESPEGIYRNAQSGAILKEMVHNRGYKVLEPEYMDAMHEWAKDNNFGIAQRYVTQDAAQAFSQEVRIAVNDLNLGKRALAEFHPEVQRAVKALETFGDYILKEAKGPHESLSVPGFESIEKRGVYIRQSWAPEKVRAEARRLGNGSIKAGKGELADRLAIGIRQAAPDIEVADSRTFASAIVNRMIDKGTGMDLNLKSYLMGDGVDLAKEMLISNGMLKEHVDDFLDKMTGMREDKGKIGAARSRLPIDIGLTVKDTKIADLMDDDLLDTMHSYSDSMSKRIALSRNGIKSRDQIEYIKNTILKELQDAGSNKTGLDKEFLDYAFSYFEDGTIGKGVHPIIRRLKNLTNLALLNKLGLTQAGETGGIIHSVGSRNFIAASDAMTKLATGDPAIGRPAMRDLGWMVGGLGNERSMVRQDIINEARAVDMTATGEIMQLVDSGLDRARDLQGIASGYYQVVDKQTQIANNAIMNRIFTSLKNGDDSKLGQKLADIGLGGYEQKLQKLIDHGHVTFNKYGNVETLNADKWDEALKDDFSAAVTRHAYQVVQKPMAGESAMFMHDSSLALLTHLKTYPMIAIKKQAVRAAANGDFGMLSVYSMGTMSLVSTLGFWLDWKEDKINATDVAKRAFNMSNTLGWIPEFYDPLAHLTGLPQFSASGGRAGTANLPALDTLSRMMSVPSAIAHGGARKEDVRALQSIPLIGNYVGMARLWSAGYDPDHDK